MNLTASMNDRCVHGGVALGVVLDVAGDGGDPPRLRVLVGADAEIVRGEPPGDTDDEAPLAWFNGGLKRTSHLLIGGHHGGRRIESVVSS